MKKVYAGIAGVHTEKIGSIIGRNQMRTIELTIADDVYEILYGYITRTYKDTAAPLVAVALLKILGVANNQGVITHTLSFRCSKKEVVVDYPELFNALRDTVSDEL